MRILFIGDVVGKLARQALIKELPNLKNKYKPDVVLANAENLAHGTGITKNTITEMQAADIDLFTTGNHAYSNEQGVNFLQTEKTPIIVPANLKEKGPGDIYKIVQIKNSKLLIINLLGQVFTKDQSYSPFKVIDELLKEYQKKANAIIVDLHAEATSEKQAFWHYVDGRVSAVLGTHTHVGTVNPRISAQGTALVEDVGMVGAQDSVIGAKKEIILHRFLTGEKKSFQPAEIGPVIINSVLLELDGSNGKTKKIQRIDLTTEL